MAISFKDNVFNNTENLLRWRDRYSKEEYPYKVVLNLFYDLIPLKELWDELNSSFGIVKFNDINISFDYVHNNFRVKQLSLQSTLVVLLKDGVTIGGLKSNSFDQLLHNAKAGANSAVEEIEFTYIVRNAIKASFLTWFSFGLTGCNKDKAYVSSFNTLLPISDWNSFDAVFSCFAQVVVAEISGLSNSEGKVLRESLYKPLPNLWE